VKDYKRNRKLCCRLSAEFEPLEIDILEDVEFPVEEGDPDDDVEVPSDDEDDKCC
jgi:hypothetical protein